VAVNAVLMHLRRKRPAEIHPDSSNQAVTNLDAPYEFGARDISMLGAIEWLNLMRILHNDIDVPIARGGSEPAYNQPNKGRLQEASERDHNLGAHGFGTFGGTAQGAPCADRSDLARSRL
jgi:hypothetical protein